MSKSHIVAIAAYWTGVDALFYWLNRKAKRIVTFHNVLPKDLWVANQANYVSHNLDDFKKIVAMCAKKFRFSTDLFNPQTLTLTFDDGYHNQYEFAFKTLREKGVPAYVFVADETRTSGGRGLLVDRLLHWVSLAPIEVVPEGNRGGFWRKVIWPRFLSDRETHGEAIMKELNALYPYEKIEAMMSDAYRRERMGGISDAELGEMRAAGWKIGWHTRRHCPLVQFTGAALREELDAPPVFKNVCLSYPYGNPIEVGDEAIRVAEALGYPCAVSNCNDAALNRTSLFFLPRLAPGADKYDFHFEMSGAKFFLKFRRLLPRLPYV